MSVAEDEPPIGLSEDDAYSIPLRYLLLVFPLVALICAISIISLFLGYMVIAGGEAGDDLSRATGADAVTGTALLFSGLAMPIGLALIGYRRDKTGRIALYSGGLVFEAILMWAAFSTDIVDLRVTLMLGMLVLLLALVAFQTRGVRHWLAIWSLSIRTDL